MKAINFDLNVNWPEENKFEIMQEANMLHKIIEDAKVAADDLSKKLAEIELSSEIMPHKKNESGGKMKQFAIVEGDMFLQRVEANENYKKQSRSIQTNPHDESEFTPIFGSEPKWFDARTVQGYCKTLIESARWDDRRHITYGLICKKCD